MGRKFLWTAAAASVLLLGALSAQQTGALWRDQARLSGGTITSGRLTVLADGSENYPWSAFGGTNLATGSMVQQPLTISIAGEVGVSYQLQSVTQTSAELPVVVTAWIVGSTASCPTSTGAVVPEPDGPVAGPWTAFPAPSTGRIVPAGTSETWCLRATVGQTAQPGKSTSVTLHFRAEQQP